jgi:Zn-dependent peptidase ImmA (M78 family)
MGYSGHFFSADDVQNQSGAPAIIFNTDDSSARQRFTIAHELGHFVLGHGTSPRDTSNVFSSSAGNPIERAANQFAAHLLMPADAIRMMISQGHSSTDALAKIFGVSTAAMSYHLVNLGLR